MIVDILNHGNIQKKNPIFCQITPTSYLSRYEAYHIHKVIIKLKLVNEIRWTTLQ